MTEQRQRCKALFDEMNETLKPNTRRPELGEFTTLRGTAAGEIELGHGWHTTIIVTFKPKTIGVKVTKTDKMTKEKTTLSKAYPLEQENLLDTILDLL